MFFVIGSRNSSNSARLVEVAKSWMQKFITNAFRKVNSVQILKIQK